VVGGAIGRHLEQHAGCRAGDEFKTVKTGVTKIWDVIQGLGEAAKPAAEPAKPKSDTKAKSGIHFASRRGHYEPYGKLSPSIRRI
jgi:hypothetical protein